MGFENGSVSHLANFRILKVDNSIFRKNLPEELDDPAAPEACFLAPEAAAPMVDTK